MTNDVMRNLITRLHRRSRGQVSKALRLWNHPTVRYVIYKNYKFYTEMTDGCTVMHKDTESCVRYILEQWEKAA